VVGQAQAENGPGGELSLSGRELCRRLHDLELASEDVVDRVRCRRVAETEAREPGFFSRLLSVWR